MKLSKHFDRSEFACQCGCGFDTVDAELITVLEHIRETFGNPILITSGARCPAHNRKVGGGENSQHLLGRAADIQVTGVDPDQVQRYIKVAYSGTYGIGSYSTFTHIDTRSTKARW